jgi:hypothetical protein
MRSRAAILVLLVSENIDSRNSGLGVTVLSGLGDGDFGDLAWNFRILIRFGVRISQLNLGV